MRRGFLAQRRADEFAALVEGPSALPAARDVRLLELVGALRGLPEAAPRPEFVADLRERLLAEAVTALVPAPAPAGDLDRLRLPARQSRRDRRLAAAVGGLAIVGASTGMAMASQSALPGDSLYPLKRAIESAHADLSVGEGSKGDTILASASDRLQEVRALTGQDRPAGDAQVADTLATFIDQATEASDLLLADYEHTGNTDSIVRLHDFASSSLDLLATLEPLVPAEARDELIRAASTLATIDSQAGQRCPACGGRPITSIPSILVALHETGPAPAVPSRAQRAAAHRHHRHGKGHAKTHAHAPGPSIPVVDPGRLGPGSVLGAGTDPGGSNGGSGSQPNPIQGLTGGLTNGLTGGAGGGTPTGQPSLPAVGDVVPGTDDTVDQLLHGVVDPVTGQTPAP